MLVGQGVHTHGLPTSALLSVACVTLGQGEVYGSLPPPPPTPTPPYDELSPMMNSDKEPLSIAGLLVSCRAWVPKSRGPAADFVGEE